MRVDKNFYRKTDQYLMPVTKEVVDDFGYDIYPCFNLPSGQISLGIETLIDRLNGIKFVLIDGYVGIFWKEIASEIEKEYAKRGLNVRFWFTEDYMHTPEKLEEQLSPYLGGNDPVFGKITDKRLKDWFKPSFFNLQRDSSCDVNIVIGCGASLVQCNEDAKLIYIDLPKNELQFRMRAGSVTNLGAKSLSDNKQMYKRSYFVDWVVLNAHKCQILKDIDFIIDGQQIEEVLFMSGDDLRNGLTAMSENFIRVKPWFEPGAWGGTWMKDHIKGLNKNVPNLAWSFELMVLENGLLFSSDNYLFEVSFDFLMYNNYKEVLGECANRFKYDFPIRFDFLDTFDGGNLSIQCHPRNEYIKEHFGMPFTQDETYYILDCKEDAQVYLGLQEDINKEEFQAELERSQQQSCAIDIEKFVQKHPAKKHDLFLIPNGTIHGSGTNNMVLEISSSPYIFTFKMYDWMRLDLDGKPRPINIQHGMNNLEMSRKGEAVKDLICKPYILESAPNYIIEHLPTHNDQFYDIERYTISDEISIATENKCHVWMIVEGQSVLIETKKGYQQRYHYAETFIIPAAAGEYKIVNEGDEKVVLVKSYVKRENN